jgi:hypothetical protein
MNGPSQLAQLFIWFGLFCVSLVAVLNADEWMVLALLAASTTLGGLLGCFVKRPSAGALIGFALMAFLSGLLLLTAIQSAKE